MEMTSTGLGSSHHHNHTGFYTHLEILFNLFAFYGTWLTKKHELKDSKVTIGSNCEKKVEHLSKHFDTFEPIFRCKPLSRLA